MLRMLPVPGVEQVTLCTDIQDDSWSGSSLGCLPQGTASLSQQGLVEKEQTVSPEGDLT